MSLLISFFLSFYSKPICVFISNMGFLYIAWSWGLIFYPVWQYPGRILSVIKYFPLTRNCHHMPHVSFFQGPRMCLPLIPRLKSVLSGQQGEWLPFHRWGCGDFRSGCEVPQPLPPDFPALLSTWQLQLLGRRATLNWPCGLRRRLQLPTRSSSFFTQINGSI